MTSSEFEKRRGRSGSQWRPAHGPDYDIEDHATIDARTRSWIAKVFVGSGIVALATAGSVSLLTGKTTLILAVWGVVGPLFGAISGYYFRSDRRDTG